MPDGADGGQPGTLVEPLRGYNFMVLVDGTRLGQFTQCSGLAVRVTPIPYRAGGEGPLVHQLPGPVQNAEVVLTRGVTVDASLWDWVAAVMNGESDRRTVDIVILDTDGVTEKLRYTLEGAWPCEFRGAPLEGLEPAYAVERVHLTFERLIRS